MGGHALLILASGLGKRFEGSDKLMADLKGKPVLQHVIEAALGLEDTNVLMICGPDQSERRALANRFDIKCLTNPNPAEGMGHSVAIGAAEAISRHAETLQITLGDMPMITPERLRAQRLALKPPLVAIMSEHGDRLMPPAIFGADQFADLAKLGGDRGARRLFDTISNKATSYLSELEACDIDTRDDLERLRKDTP